MANLKAVVNELADLEPALVADDAPGALSGNSNPAIRTKVRLHGGKGYIFAYNATNQNASTTFTWNTVPGAVAVNGEGRGLAVSGRSFSDSFGPYGAHIYVVGAGGSGGSSDGGGNGNGGATTLNVSVTNPAANATVSGTQTVTIGASGGSGNYTYSATVDGTSVYSGTNNSFSWNTTAVGNGSHVLRVTATDGSIASGSAQITVNVSNAATPPPPPTGTLKVFVTSPTANSTVTGSVPVNVWVEGQSGGTNATR
jgi:hypothetical protein